MWVYEDMTDAARKWDLSKLTPPPACDMTCSWADVVTFFNTVYPNHRVLNYVLVDDSGGFAPTDRGCAYFGLVSAGPRTLTGHEDTADGGKQANSCP